MNLLTNLEIDEVSFVDEGANPEANVTIFKHKTASDAPKVPESADLSGLTSLVENLISKLDMHVERAEDAKIRAVAERYEILGTDADKLAPMLKAAAKSNPQAYETVIKILDRALSVVEKSGVFAEVGKRGDKPPSDCEIQTLATEFQKANPNLSWRQALDMAYQKHPEWQ